MRIRRLGVMGAFALTFCGGDAADPVSINPEPTEPDVPCTIAFRCRSAVLMAPGTSAPLYTTHPLDQGEGPFPAVRLGVIVIHGTSRNGDDYFERMVAAADMEGASASTVVVAPHFQTSDDSAKPDEPYWTNSGWKRGHRSRGGGSVRLSSYEVLDSIVARFSNPAVFPNMERIVVSGHSAGGQVVHRYAASSPVDLHVSDPVRFVVANPSTYLYVTDQREWDGALIEPNRASCSDYNTWHYGMEDLNTYAEAATPDSMTTRIVRRDVVILLGDEDTGSSSLDSSCGANLQGPNRLERGRRLVRTMAELFPDSRHTQALVPGVGHSSTGMFQSEEGRAVVFRW